MEFPTKYQPIKIEQRWYDYWMKHQLFASQPDEREPYTVVIPPPNVTGVLHMGHILNNTIQDVLVRRARMMGYNACWVPGTDHASIATEAKVVNKLQQEGIKKSDLSREDFLKHAWEWTHKHGGIILEQLKKLGASCDWERTKFTMDDALSESVIKVFVDLYRKGKIYRGVRMVNWDPRAQTALSDEEVYYKELQSKLYYIRYQVEGEKDQWLTIATTRPETILGDTAVCLHPEDERYTHLHGKRVLIPLINRSVPIILDDYVDREFGTGALKITPAHDINDYELGMKHQLESIDIFNDDGTLSKAAQLFVGQDRFEVRDAIVAPLKEAGNLVKIEDYTNKVGLSERTHVPIEPKLSTQWFLAMKDLAKPALEAVMDDTIVLHPKKFKNTYRHWMENVKDWCISRQLWWGHRIPAWYLNDSNHFVVAENEAEALKLAQEKTGNKALTIDDLRQDEDALDTWFSSWLWPLSVFDGIRQPNNPDVSYYYPTNDLVTAPEILFFWVARMIIAGYEYADDRPFKNVYLTGIVRDKQRRKMSKSLGNSPDALQMISTFGADGVRVGMLLCSPAGGDLLFDVSLPEQGRNFANKIWNAFRLVKSWSLSDEASQPEASALAGKWFAEKLAENTLKLDAQFADYRISEALMTVYRLFWDEFSSVYLELIKPAYGQAIDKQTYEATIAFFDTLLKLLHPFMPFITEEIWQYIEQRQEGQSIMLEQHPRVTSYDKDLIADFEVVKSVISSIRALRADKGLSPKEALTLIVKPSDNQYKKNLDAVIVRAANLSAIEVVSQKPEGAMSFMVGTTEYFVPISSQIDVEEELNKLNKELEYQKGFLNTVMKKLGNQRFVDNAPQKVVTLEKQKKADAETKIQALENQIAALEKT